MKLNLNVCSPKNRQHPFSALARIWRSVATTLGQIFTWVVLGAGLATSAALPLEPAFLDSGDLGPAMPGSSRTVTVNPRLSELSRVELNFFSGAVFVAERARIELLGANDFVWVGRIVDEPLSEVIFTFRAGVISGRTDRPTTAGNELYDLRPAASGQCVLTLLAVGDSMGDYCQALPPPVSPPTLPSGDENPATAENPAVIDIMVAYTPAARVAKGGTSQIEAAIVTAVASANTAYQNSGVYITLQLVHMVEVNYVETGDMSTSLSQLASSGDGVMDEVHTLRNLYGADLVSLLTQDTTACGYAYVMAPSGSWFAPFAFSVVRPSCISGLSFQHELGHNMGSQHDRGNSIGSGAYPYSFGYQLCTTDGSGFRTVMAYPCGSAAVPRINWFSNPEVLFNSDPTGISFELDPTNAADNARSLNNTAHTVALFRSGPQPIPDAPSGLSVTPVDGATLSLTWTDNAVNETMYQLDRSLDGANWAQIASLPADSVSRIDNGLVESTLYYYRVRACNSSGCSEYSPTANGTTPIIPPAAPTNLFAASSEPYRVELSWVDPAQDETGFRVERSINGSGFSTLDLIGANSVAYSDGTVQPGTTYAYRVIALKGLSESQPSNVASVTTPTPPPVPTGLSASPIGYGRIQLVWNDVATDEILYQVERSTGGGPWSVVASLAPNSLGYLDAGLAANTPYSYRVRTFNSYGGSPYTTATATTGAYIPTIQSVTFNSVGTEDGWVLESGENTSIGGSIKTASTATDALILGDNNANKQYKTFVSFDTSALPDTAPIVSGKLRLKLGKIVGTSPFLTFGSAGVDMKSGTGFGGATTLATGDFQAAADAVGVGTLSNAGVVGAWSEAIIGATGLPMVDRAGRTQFRIGFSTDDNNNAIADYAGYYSGAAAAGNRPELVLGYEVTPTIPAAPDQLTAKAYSHTQIILAWRDNSGNETGFKVQRSLDGVSWLEIAHLAANVVSYTDVGLSMGTLYQYRVMALNDAGYSTFTNVALSSPGDPITAVTFTSLKAEDGYVLESAEDSNLGGSVKAGATTADALRIGDDPSDRQYKSIISFDTSALPDGANVVSAKLRIRLGTVAGTSPFLTHGACKVGIKSGSGFGGAVGLALGDFQAAADVADAGTMSAVSVKGEWSEANLGVIAFPYVNRVGRTQLRLGFAMDDNDDRSADYLGFYSGGGGAGNVPQLIVEYTIPTP